MKKEYIRDYIIPISILISFIVIPILIYHLFSNYQKHEEAKTEAKVHPVLKKKGWEDKIKTEEPIATWYTGEDFVEVTYKDEPYNTYRYYYDLYDDGRITGSAVLKDKYARYDLSKKKYKEYRKRHHFEEKYDLK